VKGGLTYAWDDRSTYVQNPPYFEGMGKKQQPIEDIVDARILGLFLDSITTDHISPAGSIKEESPAGHYLRDHQVRPKDFNQYGTRRGNHQVMMRGTFANIRIKNQMVPGVEGGVTVHYPSKQKMPMYDAAMKYKTEGVPLVVFANKEYGTGSSRDWAAKGSTLLGIRAVITQSFERIHRSNLIGMGILPLRLPADCGPASLAFASEDLIEIDAALDRLAPRASVPVVIRRRNGEARALTATAAIETRLEIDTLAAGGILPLILRTTLTRSGIDGAA
jgi:aconitate hydratase A / 2-methylisocitrate dehydratase